MDKETNRATLAIVQAEDELAALGMVIGAAWAGARAMTATSGPGISLMAEFAGLAYFVEVPAVVWDVQRIGPSTGLPTRTSQGDIFSAFYLSHGDTRHIVLLPSSAEECFSMAGKAFDLAERLQTPVFVLSDLDLGMNNWMADPFPYPDASMDRGKVLTADDLERLGSFARYRDVDRDGIAYRTLPGTKHPLAPYFARGSGHNEKSQYSERPEDYKNLVDRLARKIEFSKTLMPPPMIMGKPEARLGIVAYGSSHWAIIESMHQLQREAGLDVKYLRLRALPLTEELKSFVHSCDRLYVVEQNRDGQMADLVRLAVGSECGKIRSILHYSGIPIDARFVTDAVLNQEKGEK
jgi:2-oxoglutarate ferredoxin oxidoreductase subunit alpha